MNPIDEALKRMRAEKYAKWEERRLASMSEQERKREARLKAAAASIVKTSEEHKARLQQAHEQRIRMREASVATGVRKIMGWEHLFVSLADGREMKVFTDATEPSVGDEVRIDDRWAKDNTYATVYGDLITTVSSKITKIDTHDSQAKNQSTQGTGKKKLMLESDYEKEALKSLHGKIMGLSIQHLPEFLNR